MKSKHSSFLIQNSDYIFAISNPNSYYENEIKQALTLATINKQYYNYGTTQLNSCGQVQKKIILPLTQNTATFGFIPNQII